MNICFLCDLHLGYNKNTVQYEAFDTHAPTFPANVLIWSFMPATSLPTVIFLPPNALSKK